MKDFPTNSFGDQPDYTGFDRESWPSRENATHHQYALEQRACKTQSAQKEVEQKYGCRYSVLLQLPYFDPVRKCQRSHAQSALRDCSAHDICLEGIENPQGE